MSDDPAPGRGLLRLTGPQRLWFLQQTISADVEDLPSGRWRESVFLTPKGKVVSHFYVGVLDDDVFMDVDPPWTDLADWLVRYRFRTKVEIDDLSGPTSTVVGPVAAELAPDGEIRRVGDAIVFGLRFGAVPLAHVHGALDVDAASPEEVERLRIEAGVPRFGVDYTSDHLPQEAGLTRITSVDKGCYVGQETVARIHFRGHINKVARPVSLRDAAGVTPGSELLLDGQRIGTITSVAGSSAIAMASVEPPAGTEVQISTGGVAALGAIPEGTKVKAG